MAGRFGKYGDAKRKTHLRRKGKTGNTMPKTKKDRRQRSPKKNRKDLEENRTGAKSDITENKRKRLDRMFQEKGYTDYKWIGLSKLSDSHEIYLPPFFYSE